jgi:diguanylate cyclase (GGDEF)-like protein
MTTQELAFLIARAGIVALCAWAFVATLRRFRAPPVSPPISPTVLVAIMAVLALGIGLMAYDAFENAVLREGEQVNFSSWLWLSFDLAVPLLVLHAMPHVAKRDAAIAGLSQAATTDPLTGVANRRGFDLAAAAVVQDSRARGEPVAVIVFDLDRFKSINDRHGHPAGDAVLRRMGEVLRQDLRAGDIVARLGGEEFALLCGGLDAAAAERVAERLRADLRQGVPHPGGDGQAVTASAGVAMVAAEEAPATALDRALARADRALYAAKAAGRDQVVVALG